MYKFFVTKKENNNFYFDDEQLRHIKVLRIRENETIYINYLNEYYECIYNAEKAKLIKKLDINNELKNEITVCIPLIKQSNFEFAIQKVVELGASKIIPFISAYTDKSNYNVIKNIGRLEKIIFQATEQSFRNKICKLDRLHTFDEIMDLECKNKYLAHVNINNSEPFELIDNDALLIVGPEGGFNLKEIETANKKSAKIISLTKSILRSETALIYMLSRIKK
ncbi:16S rRNA (uracil(1498)-N(3))-methyltransferase [Helicobacter pylori]